MNKSSTDILDEKVELIYEYDNSSPLFVHVANAVIERNDLSKAIEILNKGLELYPNYAAAYMVLGKAFLLKGDYENANECFKNGSDLLHSPRSYNYYLKDLETIKKQRSPFQSLKIQDFVKNVPDNNLPNEKLKSGNQISDDGLSSAGEQQNDDSTFDNRLEEIAQNLSSVKIHNMLDESIELEKVSLDKDTNIIPSETLAKIYIAQGEYKEAIEVFKKLIQMEPEKKLYYSARMKDIEGQLDLNHF